MGHDRKQNHIMSKTADDIRTYRIQTSDDIMLIGRRSLPNGIALLRDNILDPPHR